jgi:hypothetical protein
MLFKNIANFGTTNDYLPILNSVIFTDWVFMALLFYTPFIKSKFLALWYNKYGLAGSIADILIILIGFVIARFLYYKIFNTWSIWKFIALGLVVQIIHDILFYLLFSNIPTGVNKMLDIFKPYAKDHGIYAIVGDSLMIIMSFLLASLLSNLSTNSNIVIMIFNIYILVFVLHSQY